jgi:hypothetical protein
LLGVLLWIISVTIGVITALTIRRAFMAFYTQTLARIINPWSIHIVGNVALLLAILGWLIGAMILHEYYVQVTDLPKVLRRFAIVTVPLALIAGLGLLSGWTL